MKQFHQIIYRVVTNTKEINNMDKNDTILITSSDDSEHEYPQACTWGEFVAGNPDAEIQDIETTLDKSKAYLIGGGAASIYLVYKLQLDSLHYIEEHGVYVRLIEGSLWSAPANNTAPPTPDMEFFQPVTCVDAKSEQHGQDFLDKVNKKFNKSFVLGDFDGR